MNIKCSLRQWANVPSGKRLKSILVLPLIICLSFKKQSYSGQAVKHQYAVCSFQMICHMFSGFWTSKFSTAYPSLLFWAVQTWGCLVPKILLLFSSLKELNTVLPLWGGGGVKQRTHWSDRKEIYQVGKFKSILASKISDWHPEQITNIGG